MDKLDVEAFFWGMTSAIEQTILDALRLKEEGKITTKIAKGMATNVAAEIMQNIEANYTPRVLPDGDAPAQELLPEEGSNA